MESLVGEDFHFTSPLDSRLDRSTYFARCWPNSRTITGFKLVDCVQDGDKVSSPMKAAAMQSVSQHGGADDTGQQTRRSRGLFRLVTAALGPAGGFINTGT